MVLSGQIDRIERNSRNGEIRVLDYKTIDSGDVKALTPRSVHLKKFTASSTAEEYAKFELDGKIFYWIDLQLPLYIMVLNSIDRFKNSKIHCGYFVLNKTMSNIKIYPWNDIMDYIEPAEECVKKIITNIQNKVFWPPNPKPKYENYNQLSQGYSSLEEAFECK